eukprot:5395256-Amphidinium_carterae.1
MPHNHQHFLRKGSCKSGAAKHSSTSSRCLSISGSIARRIDATIYSQSNFKHKEVFDTPAISNCSRKCENCRVRNANCARQQKF